MGGHLLLGSLVNDALDTVILHSAVPERSSTNNIRPPATDPSYHRRRKERYQAETKVTSGKLQFSVNGAAEQLLCLVLINDLIRGKIRWTQKHPLFGKKSIGLSSNGYHCG